MAHFGSGTEYALHCLLYLVGRDAAPAPSTRDLAEFQGVSVSFVAKLFTRLEKAGLVKAGEGVRGGFRLARPAERITVLQVVDAVEGRKPLFDCKEIRANCVLFQKTTPPAAATRGLCGIHAVMLQAEQEMRRALAEHSLADIAAGVAGKVPARFRQATSDWFTARAGARSPGRRPTAKKEEA